jgi:hypothetical protein
VSNLSGLKQRVHFRPVYLSLAQKKNCHALQAQTFALFDGAFFAVGRYHVRSGIHV